jgi:hypothetical protein
MKAYIERNTGERCLVCARCELTADLTGYRPGGAVSAWDRDLEPCDLCGLLDGERDEEREALEDLERRAGVPEAQPRKRRKATA